MENSEAVKSASNHRKRSTVGPRLRPRKFYSANFDSFFFFLLHSPALAAAVLLYTLLPLLSIPLQKNHNCETPFPQKRKICKKRILLVDAVNRVTCTRPDSSPRGLIPSFYFSPRQLRCPSLLPSRNQSCLPARHQAVQWPTPTKRTCPQWMLSVAL
jgi:hypothetical protein